MHPNGIEGAFRDQLMRLVLVWMLIGTLTGFCVGIIIGWLVIA